MHPYSSFNKLHPISVLDVHVSFFFGKMYSINVFVVNICFLFLFASSGLNRPHLRLPIYGTAAESRQLLRASSTAGFMVISTISVLLYESLTTQLHPEVQISIRI